MAFPTVATSVMFERGPYDDDAGATTLTNVSPLHVTIKTGRTSESEVTGPGVATITLDNRTRVFDPTYTSGAHYGNLLPGRQVRVKATWSGTDYYPFVGWISDWPQTYSPPAVADIDVPAVDALGLVALGRLPTSVYAATVAADQPLAWWRLDEQEGSVLADSTDNGHEGIYLGGAVFNTRDGLIAGDADNAIGFDHRTQYARAPFLDLSPFPGPVNPAAVSANALVYEIWQQGRILQDATALSTGYPFLLAGRAGPELLWVGYSIDRKLRVGVYPYGQLHEFDVTASKTSRRHVMVTVDPNTTDYTPVIYVNGVLKTGTPISIGTTTRSVLGVHIASIIRSFPSGDTPDLILDEAAVYPSTADISVLAPAHYAAGSAPWNGDGTLDRLANVLGLLDLTGVVSATAYPTTQHATELGSATLGSDGVAYLQKLETTEAGRLVTSFNTTDGPRLQLLPRSPSLPSVAATFTDEDDPTALHYESLTISTGSEFICNSISVRWGGDPDNASGTVTITDDDSISLFGVRHRDVDTLYANPADARAYGEYVLSRDAKPRTRITDLSINPAGDNRLFPAALGLKLGDRVQVKIKPQNVGSRVTVDCFIEGIGHTVDSGQNHWTTTYSLSALDTHDDGSLAGWWVWGTSKWGDADMRWFL